jgi:hypothetical protein
MPIAGTYLVLTTGILLEMIMKFDSVALATVLGSSTSLLLSAAVTLHVELANRRSGPTCIAYSRHWALGQTSS